MIALREVVNIMDAVDRNGSPIPFSMTVIKRSTGEIKKYERATKLASERREKPAKGIPAPVTEVQRRNPNHSFNQTRNIQLPNKDIRKIHLRLITEFNGHQVYW